MNSRIYHHGLILLLLIALAGCATTHNTQPELNIFEKIRAIQGAQFTNFEGDTVAVSDFRGKVVMIDFWETWCKPCTRSFPGVQKLVEEYPDDFVVLAVTPGWKNDIDDAKDFAEDHDYGFVYLMDAMGLHKKMEVRGIPYKVFIDPNGNFITSSMGSQGPEHDYKKIKKIIEEQIAATGN